MSVGTVLVGMVLLATLGAAVTRPWWRPEMREASQTLSSNILEEYKGLVATIRDLDFDYRAGVVTEADYRPLRDDLAARAVTVMQELDRQPAEQADVLSESSTDSEAQIEAAIRALRGQGRRGYSTSRNGIERPTVCPACQRSVRAGSRFCAQCGAALAKTCPGCGASVEADDRFCGACGESLVEKTVA
jgi:hypothetical protein